MKNAFDWQRPPTKPKRSRAKVRTIAEQRALILSDKALTFNVSIPTAEQCARTQAIAGKSLPAGR